MPNAIGYLSLNSSDYRAMAAEHHRLAGMCRSPESREHHFRLEKQLLAIADREERSREGRAPAWRGDLNVLR
jgi:hypothetical protein